MNLFSKLYQMPCPVEENFSYYLDRLRDTPYAHLVSAHSEWRQLTSVMVDVDLEVKNFESSLIEELMSAEVGAYVASVLRTPAQHVPVYDRRCEFLNRALVSVDLAEANYQTTYFAVPGPLPRTWRQYVSEFVRRTERREDFNFLSDAKGLRQRIFGKVVGGAMASRQLYQTARGQRRTIGEDATELQYEGAPCGDPAQGGRGSSQARGGAAPRQQNSE
jgi:hypothetical protein